MSPQRLTPPLTITDPEDLPNLLGLIHDEFFDLETVQFDRPSRILIIPYRRVFHGGPERLLRNRILWRVYEVDVIQSQLTIRNVEDYSFVDKERIGTYSFESISYRDGVLLIRCNEGLKVTILTHSLEIEIRDLESRGRAKIIRGPFWDSYSGKVYD